MRALYIFFSLPAHGDNLKQLNRTSNRKKLQNNKNQIDEWTEHTSKWMHWIENDRNCCYGLDDSK